MRRTATANRVGWAVIDQALSSGTNFIVVFIVARTAGLDDLGSFTLAMTFFLLGYEIARALSCDVLAIRVAELDSRAGLTGAVSAAALVGVVTSAFTLTAGFAVSGETGSAIRIMGCFVGLAIVQEGIRNGLIAIGEPRKAVLIDLVWVLTQAVTMAWYLTLDDPTSASALTAWGVAASLSALAGLGIADVRPRLGAAMQWLSTERHLWRPILAEAVVRVGFFQATVVILAGVLGVAELGRFRATQILFGPISALILLAPAVGVPEASRRPERDDGLRFSRLVSGCLAALVVVVWALVSAIPDDVGELALGDSWAGTQALIAPIAVAETASAVLVGSFIFLRSRGLVETTLKLRIIAGPMVIIGGCVGALTGGIVGAAWGIGIARSASFVLGWGTAVRHRSPAASPKMESVS